MSPNPISIEGVRSLFRLHGQETDTQVHPIATSVLQALVDKGVVTESCFQPPTPGLHISPFDIAKNIVIQDYSAGLENKDLFVVLDTLDFLEFMISPDGLNLEGSSVFEFLIMNLEAAQVYKEPRENEGFFPKSSYPH